MSSPEFRAKIKKLNLDQLKELRDQILARSQHWKSSRDGSYGTALANGGYGDVVVAIEEREAFPRDNRVQLNG